VYSQTGHMGTGLACTAADCRPTSSACNAMQS